MHRRRTAATAAAGQQQQQQCERPLQLAADHHFVAAKVYVTWKIGITAAPWIRGSGSPEWIHFVSTFMLAGYCIRTLLNIQE
jgi:hypothetical protein